LSRILAQWNPAMAPRKTKIPPSAGGELAPPARRTEVKAWLAAHADDARALAALARRDGMRDPMQGASLRALVGLRDAERSRGDESSTAVLEAMATYRTADGFSEIACLELGAAWPKFDRAEFARRMFGESLEFGCAGPLTSIEGIDADLALARLDIEVAAGCSLAPLERCLRLCSLALRPHGEVDLAPVARIPELTLLTLRGEALSTLDSLAGARCHNADLAVGPKATFKFLLSLPRLQGLRLASSRDKLSPSDRAALAALVARGVTIRAYSHQPWTIALGEIGGTFTEAVGFRTVGR
jgi:hypothetical protein